MPLLSILMAGDETHTHLVRALAQLAVPVHNAESLFERDASSLAKELQAPRAHVEEFRLHVARLCAPHPRSHGVVDATSGGGAVPHGPPFDTAASIHAAHRVSVRTGSHRLDALLGGGVGCSELTEVVGRPGSGKTQLCFTLAAAAAETGGSVVYIDTTNCFSPSRILEIARQRSPGIDSSSLAALLSRIRVVRTFCMFEAIDILGMLASVSPSPSLIILDSVTPLAAPIISGGDIRSYDRGQALVGHLSAALHRLAAMRVGVVICNEARGEDSAATASVGSVSGRSDDAGGAGPVKSALGRSWGCAVSARITLREAVHRPPPHAVPPTATRTVLATVAKHARVMSNTAAPMPLPGGCTAEISIGPGGVC